jgi:hypothetical protein
MVRKTLCVALATLCSALVVSGVAGADTGDIIAPQSNPPQATDGWQAGTCKIDPCDPGTPERFYTQASGHPPFGFTQFIVKHTTAGPLETPVGTLKNVRVDLPAGLSVNPQATPQCELATFQANPFACPPTSIVGASIITTSLAGLVAPPITVQVYNLVPSHGEPALFGFDALGSEVYLKADVEWNGDYHEGFTIAVPEPPLGAKILRNRLVFSGVAGNGTFLTNPPTCHDPAQEAFRHTYSTYLRADSKEIPDPAFPANSSRFEAALPPGTKPTGCENVPFRPGIGVAPGTTRTDSPDGATVEATVPFEPLVPIADSNVKTARMTLPLGMGLNPSAATGLAFCSDGQFGKGTRNPVACPAASKVGTVAIETPPLPAGSLTGDVFLGTQLSRDPASGNVYRIFIDAESPRYGVSARLIGNVSADPRSGQLTTTLADNPQVPFTSFKLKFNSGPRAPLTSAPTCGPNRSSLAADPYSGNPTVTAVHDFALAEAPGGGPCAKIREERPFKPGFSTRSKSTLAGAYSPFAVSFSRSDGQQELKGLDVTLPAGISGKLAGVPYCPPGVLAAAADRPGEAEERAPSCPGKSRIGVATIKAGSGPEPIELKGRAYLAGPHQGAPLSMAVLTPATAGPFDLGVVVVRVPLFVDPETARIRPDTQAIPDVYGGAKLSVRQVVVNANKDEFIVNPTSCDKLETAGFLRGGGGDPANPARFSTSPVSDPYQTSKCKSLRFRPKLKTKILSGRKNLSRAKNPKFRAILTAKKGHANLKRATVVLPKALILDQAHIRTLCTRPRQAAGTCPKGSIYGRAVATSPLLGKKLKGPVYLVPSNSILPDLMVELRGQVTIRLRASVKSVKGRMKNTFYSVPDVPVSKFVLTMRGGKRGLLTTTSHLCARKYRSKMNLRAQNGKKLRSKKLALSVPACKGGKKKKKR